MSSTELGPDSQNAVFTQDNVYSKDAFIILEETTNNAFANSPSIGSLVLGSGTQRAPSSSNTICNIPQVAEVIATSNLSTTNEQPPPSLILNNKLFTKGNIDTVENRAGLSSSETTKLLRARFVKDLISSSVYNYKINTTTS